MNLRLPHERLSAAIGIFAGTAMETRQVAQRLRQLLPARLLELKRDHTRRSNAMGAKADRLALTDERYLSSVDELTEITARARTARIQYETHAMLYKARQSLRAFNRP